MGSLGSGAGCSNLSVLHVLVIDPQVCRNWFVCTLPCSLFPIYVICYSVTACSDNTAGMQHEAVPLVVECCTTDQETWQARLQARAISEAGSCTAHKPASWDKLTALIASYVGAISQATLLMRQQSELQPGS